MNPFSNLSRRLRTSGRVVRPIKKLDLIPKMLCGALILGTVLSLTIIYSQGSRVLETAVPGEKNSMSRSVTLNEDGSTASVDIHARYNCSIPFVTSDGKYLSGPKAGPVIPAPYANFIGDTCDQKIRRAALKNFSHNVYSPLTGIHASSDIVFSIDSSLQETMFSYLTQQGILGSVFAYDYFTGQVLCSVSTPSSDSDADPDTLPQDSLLHKPVRGTDPGSIMKLVTLLLLEEKGVDLSQLSYPCHHEVTVGDNATITCTGYHGTLNLSQAIAKSCNCFFAQAITEHLDPAFCREALLNLGWTVNGENRRSPDERAACGVAFTPCSIQLSDRWDFSSVWSLIGETKTRVTPLWMAELAACFDAAEEETVMSPSYFWDISAPSARFQSVWEAIRTAAPYWSEAFGLSSYADPAFSLGKTGTYESGDEFICLQKNFFGTSGTMDIAFFVSIENYKTPAGTLSVLPQDVARFMLEQIANKQQ